MSRVLLLFPLLLTACTDRPSAREQQLEQRVARLEAQVRQLQQQAAAPGSAQRVTTLAAAQYCASELARELEAYNQDNGRYPAAPAVTLPNACADFQVQWKTLQAGTYRFSVSGSDGRELATEQR
ncbi:hypothetical protein [Deinococcus sonorensis]|uniref:Lipoprotein n=2 Tax=Deinococcus sonorensis TaxID=309891 RepID=A0AAU7UB94_9DEIO